MDTPQVLISQEPPKPKFHFKLPKIPIKKIAILFFIIATPIAFLFFIPKLNLQNPFIKQPQSRILNIQVGTRSIPTVSTVNFTKEKVNKIPLDTHISGNGIPNVATTLVFSPGNIQTKITTDSEGVWVYQIPQDIIYKKISRLTILQEDKTGRLVSLKSYRIEIYENKPKLFGLGIKEVFAQTPMGPEYAKWVTQMQAFGIYPALEGNEIILYNREEFIKKFCQPQGCLLNPPSSTDLINYVNSDQKLIRELMSQLYWTGKYAPIEALRLYFPDIDNMNLQGIPTSKDDPTLLTEVDEETLTQYIRDTFVRLGLKDRDPIQVLIDLTNPIFGTRSLINVVTLPPNQVSDNDRLNAILGFTIVYGLTKNVAGRGIDLATTSFVNVTRMIEDTFVIRRAVLAGEAAPLEIVGGRAPSWLSHRALPQPRFKPGEKLFRPDTPIPTLPGAQWSFTNVVKPALEAGEGFVISRSDVIEPVANNIRRAISEFEARTGRKLPINTSLIDRTTQQGTAYVVPDKHLRKAFPDGSAAAYTADDAIVFGFDRYNSARGIGSMHHEMTHMLGVSNHTVGWTYKGPTEKDQVFTTIYELMTDAWADLAMGQRIMSAGSHIATGGYAGSNPHIIDALFNRLFRYNPALLDDFLAFAVHKNADQLVNAVLGNNGVTNILQRLNLAAKAGDYHKFLAYFRQGRGVNFAAVSYTGVGAALAAGGDKGIDSADPVIDLESDFISDNFISDESLANQIKIDGVEGQFLSGKTIDTSVIISQDGVVVDPTPYSFIWSIEPEESISPTTMYLFSTVLAQTDSLQSINDIQPIPGTENCLEKCTVTLPPDLSPGNYQLTVYLVLKGGDQIIASDSYPVTIETPPLSVAKIDIDGQELWPNPMGEVKLALDKGNGVFLIKVAYSDGTTKLFNLTFKNLTPPSLENCTYQEEPQNCQYGGTRSCTGVWENDVCMYDQSGQINPNCQETCNPTPSASPGGEGSNCTSPPYTTCFAQEGKCNQGDADSACGAYYQDGSYCDQYDPGPRGDGCFAP